MQVGWYYRGSGITSRSDDRGKIIVWPVLVFQNLYRRLGHIPVGNSVEHYQLNGTYPEIAIR